MINKIVRKSMLKKKGLLFAIAVLIIISSTFVGLSHFVYDSMDVNFQSLKSDSNVEDFRLYTLPVKAETFKKIYSNDEIKRLENKFNMKLELEKTATYRTDDDKQVSYGIIKYDANSVIDQPIVMDGKLPTKGNQVMMQPPALANAGLSIGDTIDIDGRDYTISGTGYFVQYILPSDFMNNQMFPDFDKFTPLLMSPSGYENLDQDSENLSFSSYYKGKFYNQMGIKKLKRKVNKVTDNSVINVPVLDDNGKPQITKTGTLVTKEVNRFMFGQPVNTNPNISSVSNEIKGSRTTFTFLAGLLSIITAFLAVILVNSVFKSQRREMGIMKAEGVSIFKLGIGFATFIGIVIAISAAIGGYISTFAAKVMRDMYADMYILKDYPLDNTVITTVVTQLALIGIAVLVAVYFISIRKNLNTPTLHLVKNIDSEKAPKHNISKVFKHLNFIRKYQLNLTLRNLPKTLLLGFAVYISSFLILLGVLMYTSVHNMMDNMYGENFKFSYVVMFSEPNIMTADQVENETISLTPKLVSVPHEELLDEPLQGNETVQLEGYDFDTTTTVFLNDVDGQPLSNDTDGAIASSGFMKKYHLKVGDEITVTNPYKADTNVKIKIADETDDYWLPMVYMPIDEMRETFGLRDDMITGYQSTDKLTNATRKKLKDEDPGAFIYEAADMEQMMGDSLHMLNVAIVIIGVLAAVIAFVALYSISSVIIESNRKTISVMKVLGYSTKEVRTMTIGIYKWFVIIIYLASIPILQSMIQSTINQAMADMDFTLKIHLDLGLSLLGLVVILIVYLISSKLTFRKISKIKLSEALKADE